MIINLGHLKNMSEDLWAILYLNVFICAGQMQRFLYYPMMCVYMYPV